MTKKILVSINILTYNSQNLIKLCLDSVLKQTYSNIEILIIDNASQDNTLDIIRDINKKTHNNIKIIKNKKNLGFSTGHNIGIKKSKGKYVLCLNVDIVLDKNFVKDAFEAIEVDKKIGAIQGKLYKVNKMKAINRELLDTTGLILHRNRRIVNRGQGKKDKNQYDRGEIFGADGAAPLYRRVALEDIKLPIFKGNIPSSNRFEYFDEDFFMFKEDVDLAWRLRLYEWKTAYEPKAVGYHLRGAGEKETKNYISIAIARRKISDFAKFYSFKNQRLMQIKNELPGLIFRHFCCMIIKEISAWIYVLLFEKYGRKAIKELMKQTPNALRKRKIIMTRKKASSQEMKKWFI